VFTLLSARQNYRQAVRRRDEARAARIAREARAAALVEDEVLALERMWRRP
jgi:hypothetical protein